MGEDKVASFGWLVAGKTGFVHRFIGGFPVVVKLQFRNRNFIRFRSSGRFSALGNPMKNLIPLFSVSQKSRSGSNYASDEHLYLC
jgi:hypothetical protein